jgi:anti-anti-sigma factor
MEVKVDTKEKFTTIAPQEPHLYDNMAADLAATCTNFLDKSVKNVVLNMQKVTGVEANAAQTIASLQQQFYEQNASFVICEINPPVEEVFDQLELLELLNITPTESEAWDIVQMEEIERELLDTDDIAFNKQNGDEE